MTTYRRPVRAQNVAIGLDWPPAGSRAFHSSRPVDLECAQVGIDRGADDATPPRVVTDPPMLNTPIGKGTSAGHCHASCRAGGAR